ncbi:MAG: YafY family transcriptional regulator [Chloroflexi bacterium]|nr:YafY family transcriptional regulator [Chloroflexota bacterium]
MRASRLLSILLLLQTRGHLTAGELADELEVSVRTVYRDIEALSEAGVPVYTERGPHGGVRLVDGYRTRLTGLTSDEAQSLFLSGLPGPAAELGLGTVVAAARLKVLAALPPELRSRASRLGERFHLDAPGWFRSPEAVPHLQALATAVWEDRLVRIRYDRGDRSVERLLAPLGLVIKGGVWYLVALVDGAPRTYRVSRVIDVVPTEDPFQRPADFDLATFWTETTSAYEAAAERLEVTLRVDPDRLPWLMDAVGEETVRGATRLDEPDDDGWLRIRMTVEWPREVHGRVLALGDAVEVLGPPELRQRVIDSSRRVLRRYGALPQPDPSSADPMPTVGTP